MCFRKCFRSDYPVEIIVGNISYPTLEHAYQAAKTDLVQEKKEIAKSSISEARNLGYNLAVLGRQKSNWLDINLNVMESLVRIKFTGDEDCKKELLSTGTEEIIVRRDNDKFWGVDSSGTGHNYLGKILMKIREELRFLEGLGDVEDYSNSEDDENEEWVPSDAVSVDEFICDDLYDLVYDLVKIVGKYDDVDKSSVEDKIRAMNSFDLSEYYDTIDGIIREFYDIKEYLATMKQENE